MKLRDILGEERAKFGFKPEDRSFTLPEKKEKKKEPKIKSKTQYLLKHIKNRKKKEMGHFKAIPPFPKSKEQ